MMGKLSKHIVSKSNYLGSINLMGSKSISHRAAIASFLANKSCVISNFNFCDDTLVTIDVLKKLGGNFKLDYLNKTLTFINRDKVTKDEEEFSFQESASSLRMLLPLILTYFSKVKVKGSIRLLTRGFKGYDSLFKKNNIEVKLISDTDIEQGYMISGRINDQDLYLEDVDSSQYISGLLFLLCRFSENKILYIKDDYPSKDYIKLTFKVLNDFSFNLKRYDKMILRSYSVLYLNRYRIESDLSSLPYFAILGLIKGFIKVMDINIHSYQGDVRFLDLVMDNGGKMIFDKDGIIFLKSMMKGFTFSLDDNIDLGPILMVLGAFTIGKTIIKDVERLKNKESDRLENMILELRKANVDISYINQEIVIEGKPTYHGNFAFSSHDDHRIAMALIIFIMLSEGEGTIDNISCINKSFPLFFNEIESLVSKDDREVFHE